MPEAEKLEKQLHRVLFRDTEYYERAKSLLFNGGLSALQAALLHIDDDVVRMRRRKADEGKEIPPVFKTDDIYFGDCYQKIDNI